MREIKLVGRYRELADAAKKARERAYAPYSNFAVGAAVLGADGQLFLGCNVENISYGLSICAERAAVFTAVAAGCKEFKALAVIGPQGLCPPCGACRQVISEFGTEIEVVMVRSDDTAFLVTASELLPHAFGFDTRNCRERSGRC